MEMAVVPKIIADDEEFNGGLFQKEDGNWDAFVREIGKIDSTINKGKCAFRRKSVLKWPQTLNWEP